MSTSAARNIDYNGSIAYDLSRFDKRKRVRDALEKEPVAVPRPIAKPGERTASAAIAKARPAVAASTVIGFLLVAVLMFLVVLNYMRLNELSIGIASMQSEYEDLKSEAAVLTVENEQMLNVRKIEEQAVGMGMGRPADDQMVYIDMSQPDRGVILTETNEGSDFLEGIRTFFFAAVDFFR